MTNDDTAARTIDARGMRCPWPALRLARAMRTAADVVLIADDPQAGREVQVLAAENGWRIEGPAASPGEERWRISRD